jgi:hypothetical protein
LIGGEVIAIDGKSRAHNSKKANFNQIDKHLAYIEAKTQEYLGELAKMIYRISPVKQLCMARPAGREIDRNQYARGVEENNKRY